MRKVYMKNKDTNSILDKDIVLMLPRLTKPSGSLNNSRVPELMEVIIPVYFILVRLLNYSQCFL